MKKLLSLLMAAFLCVTMIPTAAAAEGTDGGEFDARLRLEELDWTKSADGSYYSAKVVYATNVVSADHQFMNVYVPAAYLEDGECCGYTADTAPIVLLNNCMGWNSSTPGEVNPQYIAAGFVYVSCGARSRDLGALGKAPTPVVDLKSAVRMLRLNADLIPGDEERIVSIGTSGGGQMSSILGASGNMEEYYSYLYENGAAGIAKQGDVYVSTIDDDIFAAQCYCPITDLANGDLAYAWMRCGAGDTGFVGMFGGGATFDELQLTLQDRMAEAYCEYINSLGLVNEAGEALSADGVISGSYYEQILANISASFNTFVEAQTFPYSVVLGFGPTATTITYDTIDDLLATYSNTDGWLVKNEDGSYSVTDLAGFINGTNLVRNKNIPGYDPMDRSEENNAFGTAEQAAVHYSASTAAVMAEMLADESLKDLITEEYAAIFNDYITEANDPYVVDQVYLMNSTQILLDTAAGKQDADFAAHWRIRSGTADEHASFSVGYNLSLAAGMAGADVDYTLVWGMVHGDGEGTTTGTFVDWVNELCGQSAQPEQPGEGGEQPPEGEPPAGDPPAGDPIIPDAPEVEMPDVTADFEGYKAYLTVYAEALWAGDSFVEKAKAEVAAMTESNYTSEMMYTILVNDCGAMDYASWLAYMAAQTPEQPGEGGEQSPEGEPPAGDPPVNGSSDPSEMVGEYTVNPDGTVTLVLGGIEMDEFTVNGEAHKGGETVTVTPVNGVIEIVCTCEVGPFAGLTYDLEIRAEQPETPDVPDAPIDTPTGDLSVMLYVIPAAAAALSLVGMTVRKKEEF